VTTATVEIEFRTLDTYVSESPGRGRGVYAARSFDPGELIEVCPTLQLTSKEFVRLCQTILNNYWYEGSNGGVLIALGHGALYNHAPDSNAEYRIPNDEMIRIFARRYIQADEEILINYNGDPANKEHIEFDGDVNEYAEDLAFMREILTALATDLTPKQRQEFSDSALTTLEKYEWDDDSYDDEYNQAEEIDTTLNDR